MSLQNEPEFQVSPETLAAVDKTWDETEKIPVIIPPYRRKNFKSGACHILAEVFLKTRREWGYSAILILPKARFTGVHVFVCRGDHAFDWRGDCTQARILKTWRKKKEATPGYDYELHVLGSDPFISSDFIQATGLSSLKEHPDNVEAQAEKFIDLHHGRRCLKL